MAKEVEEKKRTEEKNERKKNINSEAKRLFTSVFFGK